MKALLLSEYKHLVLADLPVPSIEADEVLVRVAACGICGSDVHGYDGSTGRRIPPIVMGHEAAGVVEAVGSKASGLAVGDRVTFDSTISCGECGFCTAGEINLCDHRQVMGVSCAEFRRAGAFAEFVAVPARVVYRLPDELSFPEAAMLEAVSVALHAVRLSGIQAGETGLVIGAGMIGLLTLQAARAAGLSRVLVADVDRSRLELAKDCGADETLLLSGDALTAEVCRRTEEKGVDLALEAVGTDATVSAAIGSVRRGGRVTLIGNVSPEVTLPLQKVVTRQLRLQGSCASSGEYPEAMEMIAKGQIRVAPLISAVAPLREGPRWFSRLYAREPNLMKVVLSPNA
ncbi:MAG TPA: galactitol-1-phosphate 5-dehydrogenase [Acidobacteriaceae bacterium]|jgi:L-iditol 2-dehydrogenase|nr:galactitol-1-phosphate 5-dehydrogenase [Acidobacteriaceae bacterium]